MRITCTFGKLLASDIMLPEAALLVLSFTLAVHHGTSLEAAPIDLVFSFITSFGGSGFNSSGIIPAVDLALEHVNARPDLLAGYKFLYLSVQDSEVSSDHAAYPSAQLGQLV